MTHKGDPDFLTALDELRALHLSKGGDYATIADPLRNYVQSSQDCGVEPWRGALLRLSEKYHRITNLLAKQATPNHESIEDTLMDLAALALIVRSLRRREQALSGTVEVQPGVYVANKSTSIFRLPCGCSADATGEP
jgi:hypothetical protein